jgi:hypothetical protein
MRPYEQIALKTLDVSKRAKELDRVYPFFLEQSDKSLWVMDHVHAVHVYLHPRYLRQPIGSAFEVRLAFNYDIVPTKELELIQLCSGASVQLIQGDPAEGLSHLGYHIPDSESLVNELTWWNSLDHTIAQVSLTTDHLNSSRRYLYAFVDTLAKIGTYTKVIQRLTARKTVDQMVEEFSHVNHGRR